MLTPEQITACQDIRIRKLYQQLADQTELTPWEMQRWADMGLEIIGLREVEKVVLGIIYGGAQPGEVEEEFFMVFHLALEANQPNINHSALFRNSLDANSLPYWTYHAAKLLYGHTTTDQPAITLLFDRPDVNLSMRWFDPKRLVGLQQMAEAYGLDNALAIYQIGPIDAILEREITLTDAGRVFDIIKGEFII